MACEPLVMVYQIKKKRSNIDIFIWWLLETNRKCQKENPSGHHHTLWSSFNVFFISIKLIILTVYI